MKAWTVIAATNDGELICLDCLTKYERKIIESAKDDDEIKPVFSSDECRENCDRCGTEIN